MKINFLIRALVGVLFLLVTGINTVNAMDQADEQRYIDFDKETPSGTVELEGKQVALLSVVVGVKVYSISRARTIHSRLLV